MKKSVNLVLLFSMSAFCLASQAAPKVYIVNICQVQTGLSGKGLIRPCAAWTSVNGCSNRWIQWDITSDGGKAMYSTALTAFIAGKEVGVRIDNGATCNGYDDTTMIRAIK